jgi:hypothetical protein
MPWKQIILIAILLILAAGGAAGMFFMNSGGGGSAGNMDDPQTSGNNTALENTATGDQASTETGEWELILSENNTFVDGESGHGSDTLTINADGLQRLNIKMHIISELCVACGGNGWGEVTLVIQTPGGDVVHRDVYTASSDLNLLWSAPEQGEWEITIDGVAVGDAYRVGYSAQVLGIAGA